jgi:putative MATE family efflux protein
MDGMGRLQREIRRMSLPTMWGFLCQALYDMVDMLFIGMMDKAAVAAATLFITVFWVLDILNEIVGASSVSMISQAWGAHDKERTRLVSQETLWFKVVLAIIGATVMIAVLPAYYRFFSDDPQVVGYGLSYGVIRLAFLPVFFSSYTVNTIFRCTGDAKTPMRLLVAASVINIVLDPLLMFSTVPGTTIPGLGLGIAGAAWATVISISFSFGVGFFLLFSGKAPIRLRFRELFRLHRNIDRDLFLIGLPSGLNLLMRNLANFIVIKLVSSYGTDAIAMLGVATRMYQFAVVPSNGIAMGSGIIVGHALGAEEMEDARKTVALTSLDCTAITLGLAALMGFLPGPLLSLFLGGAAALREGILLMRVFAPCLLCQSVMSGFTAAFTGSGDTRPILTSALVSQWLFLVPYAMLVTLALHLGIGWLWLAYLVGDATDCLWRLKAYRTGRWMTRRVNRSPVRTAS